jgi:hypothetical protein
VRPGPDRQVRLLDGTVLKDGETPQAGVVVEDSVFIARRIAAGDLVEVIAPATRPAASSASTSSTASASSTSTTNNGGAA